MKQSLVGKKNEQFSKLSKQAQRIAIAKDVLELLKIDEVKPKRGVYIDLDVSSGDYPARLLENGGYDGDYSVQQFLPYAETCTVCAIGSMVVSKCRINGDAEVLYLDGVGSNAECGDSTPLYETLEKYFPHLQLSLIETAFETNDMMWDDVQDDFYDNYKQKNEDDADEAENAYFELVESAIKFGRKYKKDSDRLVAIMQNIVKNEGVFVP